MVSAPSDQDSPRPLVLKLWQPPLAWWLRGLLTLSGLFWLVIFGIAFILDPYKDGQVHLMETHTQLGLRPCTFKTLAGLPCPSCGMSTSFALLVRGDLYHSAQANFAGTLLALIGLAYVPWSFQTAWRGRWAWFRSPEAWFIRLTILFVSTMLIRWLVVVLVQLSRK